MSYTPQNIEKKWQDKWLKDNLYRAEDFSDKPKHYVLVEFPYPSGEGMHIGHTKNYSMMDAYARLMRMKGYNVLYPMGWDAFGLPAENYAIKTKRKPRDITIQNTSTFEKQLKSLGLSFDWERKIDTTDPKYYKWTQWIFLKLLEKGLAYKAEIPINWCPKCKVGCANEEVIGGKHERCGSEVAPRIMSQWLLKITAYADRLTDDLDEIDYPESVKASQRNWIGRKEWCDIDYEVFDAEKKLDFTITVSTSRPDTNFGASFVVLAPESETTRKLLTLMSEDTRKQVESYIKESLNKSEEERNAIDKEKTGIFTGFYCLNTLNGTRLPIYIADYALMNVGTGAVVGVPGHDERDFQFARKFDLPVKRVVSDTLENNSEIKEMSDVYSEDGFCVNSDFLNGLKTEDAKKKVIEYLIDKGVAKKTIRYKLHDWIFSRQRYWGEPIPVVLCPKCGIVPLDEKDLPLELPDVESYEPTDDGTSPLSRVTDWVNTECPRCRSKATRETDTMPNWAGSSWYFLRYLDPHNDNELVNKKIADYWMPVNIYDGGPEHINLHLLYSRFWYKFLSDIGVVSGKEPYAKRRIHGMVLGEGGVKMSKSLGNTINPDDLVEQYGADTTRAYLLFMGPYDSDSEWNTRTIQGVKRFLSRYYDMIVSSVDDYSGEESEKLNIEIARLAKKVSEDIQSLKFNTAIAALMKFLNNYESTTKSKAQIEKLIIIIAPVAPHLAEELWLMVGNEYSVHKQEWVKYENSNLIDEQIEIPVVVNGKVRGRIVVDKDCGEDEAAEKMLADEKIKSYLVGKTIVKKVYVPRKIINIIVK